MAILTKTQLKALWINGFIPDQDDYVDLFDSLQAVELSSGNEFVSYVERNVNTEEFYDIDGGYEMRDPRRLILSSSIQSSHNILSVSASYETPINGNIFMTVESIDDPVNAGRKALQITALGDENLEHSFSLSGSMEFFGTSSVSNAFSFDGTNPEILIDNIDPAAGSGLGMRFINTQESDLTCVNITVGGSIKTFGTSSVFNNTFTYGDYIDGGNTEVLREGTYIRNKINQFVVPSGKIAIDSLNNIVIDADGLPYLFLTPEANRRYDIKVDYLEVSES